MSDNRRKACESYGPDQIRRLEGIEGVRLRPAMYIGGTDTSGLHHLAWEVIDNSFDEYENGNATSIYVRLHADGSLSCEDDGGGIPVDPLMPTDPRSWVEVVCTEFFAGGRFQRKRYGAGICHGVGLVAVNALSEWLVIDTHRQGKRWHMQFERGAVMQGLTETGLSSARGTRVWFKPDGQIFGSVQLNYRELRRHLQVETCLWPGVTSSLFDETTGQHETIYSTEGAADLLRARAWGTAQTDSEIIRIQGRMGSTVLDCALQQIREPTHLCEAYVNGLQLLQGGTVVTGFQNGVLSAIGRRARAHCLPGAQNLMPEGCLAGLAAVISVRLEKPHFEGPTRTRISNPELVDFMSRTVADGLNEYFREHPDAADRITRAAVAQLHS